MALDLTKIPVFGKRVYSPTFESQLLEAFQKTVPELIAIHHAIGTGTICDWVTIFEPGTLKKIHPAEFLVDFDVDSTQTLVVASSSDGKEIAVGKFGEHFRYHLVFWKHDEVAHFDSFEECLQSLLAEADPQHLFLFSPTMLGIALDIAWESGEVLRLVQDYLDSLGTQWKSFTEGETRYFYDSTQQFMIQMRDDESSQNVCLHFEKERHPELQELVQRWADHAKACNLPKLQMG